MSKPKLFVSYSRRDAEYLNEFKVHLAGLKRNKKIEVWTDQEIVPSDKWKQKLKQELETADIMVFLLSPDFIASDFIYEEEVMKAIERRNKGEVVILPIIIRPCDFSSTPLTDFQALPRNAEPISTWENKDEAWMNVVDGLKRTIDVIGKEMQPSNNDNQSNDNASSGTNPTASLDDVRMKIAGGNIGEAINDLLEITKGKDHYNSMIMQSSKYNRSKKEYANDLLTIDQYKRSTAQIENALLAIVDELGLD